MSRLALKGLQAAAGAAGGDPVYVDDVFSTFLYEGTQATLAINNGIDLSGEGGLAWFKCRNVGMLHNLFDTVRGNTQRLDSSGTSVQSAQAAGRYPTFTSTGFTLGADDGGDINYSGREYVSWSFRKQEKFFDIVTYTGNGNADRQINHNLGSVPGMMIIKKYVGSTTRWSVFHRSIGTGKFLSLDDTAAVATQSDFWETAPTATQFTVETNGNVNKNGDSYVAYLFAHDAQNFGTGSDEAIIKCGTYEGTGSDLSIDLGFEPQWILFKNADATVDWVIRDNMRGITDGYRAGLYPNLSDAEYTHASGTVALTPTGFRLPLNNSYYNRSGETFIYVAIRRPHKPASEFAATDLFKQNNNTTTTSPEYVSGFPVDFALQKTVDETGYTQARTRLTGKNLYTPVTDVEAGSPEFDYSTGFMAGGSSTNADEYAWMWRRAPGFFDVVAYTGNATANRQLAHNLGVVPEFMIAKTRDAANYWVTYDAASGPTKFMILNQNNGTQTSIDHWYNTTPTASFVTLGDGNYTNRNATKQILYLFASVAGVSKVGSYTGTGSNVNVDCGFSAGARFILIKRTDSTGDWYLYDSARGIVAGNDPYLLLNTTAAEVTNTDYIDPLSSGFTVTSSAPAELNASGGTYLFYAIA